MGATIIIGRSVTEAIMGYARMLYLREAIPLLRGKTDKYKIIVKDTQIPPLATHGTIFPLFLCICS